MDRTKDEREAAYYFCKKGKKICVSILLPKKYLGVFLGREKIKAVLQKENLDLRNSYSFEILILRGVILFIYLFTSNDRKKVRFQNCSRVKSDLLPPLSLTL